MTDRGGEHREGHEELVTVGVIPRDHTVTAAPASPAARALRQVSVLLGVRHVLAAVPVDQRTLAPARTLLEHGMRAAAPVLGGTSVDDVADGPVRGEWVRGPRATRDDAAVLYVHGGGFVAGSSRSYRGVAARLSTATRLPVFTLDYRLAPEHPHPAASQDVVAAYRWLLNRGCRPDRIVLAGDSAGGYLAADFAITHAAQGDPRPACLLLFSPMADLSLDIAERSAHRDTLIGPGAARAAVAQFTAEPLRLRPVAGTPLPPTLIHVGDDEFFTADAVALAAGLRAAGAHCLLHIWPGQLHVFHTLPAVVPESRSAYRAAARFVAAHLDPAAA
ncbi:alpha/beta hydrolase [Nocardia aurantiaca]|uniref:Alpha/beta hydrolase fold domain-containing protein n=1 Tax=Nocardia aurantiaca TaxID=2675850 RepID=A0A6I3KWJ1_9NOCA|nr:alpha/beta hydrolase [Nocardia aurantiaca]MTE12845.1 alpha/beta hydrolase fold domain-containing protein [Nocardia aurantiaca]